MMYIELTEKELKILKKYSDKISKYNNRELNEDEFDDFCDDFTEAISETLDQYGEATYDTYKLEEIYDRY